METRGGTRVLAGDPSTPGNVWLRGPFIGSHVAAAVLIVSWIFPPTRNLWDLLDIAVFKVLNGSLALGEGWLNFWAFANHRSVDLVSGSLCAAIIIWWVWGERRDIQNRRAAALGALTVPLLVIPFTAHLLIKFVFNFQRYSPTLVIDDALRLTKLMPGFETKDISIYSFPGDHAFILFSIAFYFWYYANRKVFLAMLALAVVFNIPRLVGGAHWLTDDIIGGIAPALIVVAWVCATPFAYHFTRLTLPVVNAVVGLIPERLWIPDYTKTPKRK